jgi:hypothetical protein
MNELISAQGIETVQVGGRYADSEQRHYVTWRFRDRQHADYFAAMFGGTLFR